MREIRKVQKGQCLSIGQIMANVFNGMPLEKRPILSPNVGMFNYSSIMPYQRVAIHQQHLDKLNEQVNETNGSDVTQSESVGEATGSSISIEE